LTSIYANAKPDDNDDKQNDLTQRAIRHIAGPASGLQTAKGDLLPMARITDVKATIWKWIGPAAPMHPHSCATASDRVSDVSGSILDTQHLWELIYRRALPHAPKGIDMTAISDVDPIEFNLTS
jgi:hypothetical protein